MSIWIADWLVLQARYVVAYWCDICGPSASVALLLGLPVKSISVQKELYIIPHVDDSYEIDAIKDTDKTMHTKK